jgi:hypothetical protein
VDKVGAVRAWLKKDESTSAHLTKILLNFHQPVRWSDGSYLIFIGCPTVIVVVVRMSTDGEVQSFVLHF